jgi:hypothetical protein
MAERWEWVESSGWVGIVEAPMVLRIALVPWEFQVAGVCDPFGQKYSLLRLALSMMFLKLNGELKEKAIYKRDEDAAILTLVSLGVLAVVGIGLFSVLKSSGSTGRSHFNHAGNNATHP